MPEKHIYEYAVVRIVPKVEREEFINVGVILFSKQAAFIRMRYEINKHIGILHCTIYISQ